jgi:hypothetical protein
MLKIRIIAQEKYFRSLRESVGIMRQRRQSMAYDEVAIKIQNLCGEIELSLYRCRQLIERG